MFILKTVIYESKRLDFQNEQALFLKFYYWAHQKTGGFRAGTTYQHTFQIFTARVLLKKT
jgi:hypothetical protein